MPSAQGSIVPPCESLVVAVQLEKPVSCAWLYVCRNCPTEARHFNPHDRITVQPEVAPKPGHFRVAHDPTGIKNHLHRTRGSVSLGLCTGLL
jgi:hypothetical protein